VMRWGGKPFQILLEQGFVWPFQGMDGFFLEPRTLELAAAGKDELIDPTKLFQQLDKARAPEVGGAERDQPIRLRGDSKPPACTRWSTYLTYSRNYSRSSGWRSSS